MLNFSKYNYLFQNNELYYIYNSLSNAFAEVDYATFKLLQKLSSAKHIDKLLLDNEFASIKKDLIDAKILADDEKEIARIKYKTLYDRFDNSFLSLTINPTIDCNFACSYCFEKGFNKSNYMNKNVQDQTIRFIKSYLPKINSIYVTWFGGEPLMAFDVIENLTDEIKKMKILFGAKMISNGYLLTMDKITKLDNLLISSIQITIDGSEKIHNKRRVLKNKGKGTFKQIIINIKNLLKYSKCNLIVRVNIDKSNELEYIKICKFFMEEIDEIYYDRISIVPGFVDDINSCNNICSFDRNAKSIFLMDMYNKYGVKPFNFYPNNDRYECPTRNTNTFTIGPMGELYKCWNDVGNPQKEIGNINTKKFNDDNDILLMYLTEADPLNDQECNDCFLFPVCGGGCPYERIEKKRYNKNIDTCDLIKNNIDNFLKIHLDIKSKLQKE